MFINTLVLPYPEGPHINILKVELGMKSCNCLKSLSLPSMS